MADKGRWWALYLGLSMGSLLAGIHTWVTPYRPFAFADYTWQSLFFQWRGPQPPHPDVVILAIDEDSLRLPDLFEPDELEELEDLQKMQGWPWPREIYGSAIEKLITAGADTVAIDLIFTTPSVFGPEDDQAFAQILERHKDQVILAESNPLTTQSIGFAFQSEVQVTSLPVPTLDIFNLRTGNVDLPVAPNQQIFEIPGLQTLAPPSQQDMLTPPLAVVITQGSIPPTNLGINYSGPQGTYPTYPIWWLFEPIFWEYNLDNGSIFKDKIVLIGSTAYLGQDLLSTPLDPTMPGVEIHANAVGTLLNDQGIRLLHPLLLRSLMLLTGLVAGGALVVNRNSVWKIVMTALGIGGSVGLGYGLFLLGWTFPTTAWLTIVGVTGGLDIALTGVQEQFSRLRLRRILERRVSPAVLQEILNQPEAFTNSLGGKVCAVGILFADIRGFTTLASSVSAVELVTVLNEYFAKMAEPILAQQGTLDKFIGDAVMAEFGTPLSRGPESEALAAVQAALGMRRALHEFRAELQQQGKPPIFHGIGINFGEVVAGNLGSSQKIEYTVIGDAVNVAARLEGLTKDVNYDIIISDSMNQLVQEAIWTEDLGEFAVKGKAEPVRIHAVIDVKGGDGSLCEQVQQAYQAARAVRAL